MELHESSHASASGDPTETVATSNSPPPAPRIGAPPSPQQVLEKVGIDKLHLGIDLHQVNEWTFRDNETRFLDRGKPRRATWITLEVAGMTIYLNVMAQGDWYKAFAYGNPARWDQNPRGWDALPVNDLPQVVNLWAEAIYKHVIPVRDPETWEVRRLDVARPHAVPQVDQRAFLDGWDRMAAKARSRSLWSGADGTPNYLAMTTKTRGQVIAYDHHNKHHTSPPDTFRIEAQAGKEWCAKYGGIEQVADISPSAVSDLYLNRVAWAGFDNPVVQAHERLRLLYEHAADPTTDLTVRQLPGLVGHQAYIDAGMDLNEGKSAASQRRAATLVAGVAHLQPHGPTYIRLDPERDEPLRSAA